MHGHDCHQGLFARNLFVGQRIPLAGVAHQNGTIRFGHDPKHVGARPNCQAHEVDNLYVVDGSFFPVERRGESGADDHGQRAARRRPPARNGSDEQAIWLPSTVSQASSWSRTYGPLATDLIRRVVLTFGLRPPACGTVVAARRFARATQAR